MSRRLWIALAALLLVSSLAVSRGDDGGFGVSDDEEFEEVEDQGAHLVARKFLPGKDLVVGRNTTVAIELYNAGNRCSSFTPLTTKDSCINHIFAHSQRRLFDDS